MSIIIIIKYFVKSTSNTEGFYQAIRGNEQSDLSITINGQRLKTVECFVYFGRTLSKAFPIDDKAN